MRAEIAKFVDYYNLIRYYEVLGNVTSFGLFKKIFFNNLKVLFFCLSFAFLYGAGAIFILTWNASVIATAMGGLIKNELAQTASLVGFGSLASYFSVAAFGFFRYMTHGLFEIIAYFVAKPLFIKLSKQVYKRKKAAE